MCSTVDQPGCRGGELIAGPGACLGGRELSEGAKDTAVLPRSYPQFCLLRFELPGVN